MTEFNNTPRIDFDPLRNEQDKKALEVASKDLRDLLKLRGQDPKEVMLWGYDAKKPQPSLDEHTVDDTHRLLHVGTIEDTELSEDADRERQEEAWMVNPLKYAIEGGSLEVFNRKMLEELPHEVDKDGFGTMIVTVTDEEMHKAKILHSSINVIRNPRTLRMSEKDHHLLWNANPEDAEAVFGVAPDSGIIKIEVEAADGSTHTEYMDTVEYDFGVHLTNVIEVGRIIEPKVEEPQESPEVDQSDEPESEEEKATKASRQELIAQLESALDEVDTLDTTLESIVGGSKKVEERFNRINDMWNSVKYSFGGSDREAFSQEVYGLQAEATALAQSIEPARRAAQTIAERCEVLHTSLVSNGESEDTNTLLLSRNAEEFATELLSNVRGALNQLSASMFEQLSQIITHIDNMSHDNYGHEAYIASINQGMMMIEDSFRFGRVAKGQLLRAQQDIVELRTLRARLNEEA